MGKTGQTNTPHRRGYEFGEFTLDLDRAGLYRHNVDLQLRPQVLDVLCYLVARSGSLVTKEELLDEIWGDKAVTDDSLTHCIIEIRKALGDDNRQVIRTVPRRGFVFEEPVRRLTLTGSGMTRIRRLSRLRLIAAVGVAVVAAVYSIAATRPVETSGSGDEATANLSEYYEQARFLFHRRSPGDLDSAQEYYLNAIELDAQSAEAWAGLAGVYRIQSSLHEERREVLLDQLKAAAEKAIEIDPQNAEGCGRAVPSCRLRWSIERQWLPRTGLSKPKERQKGTSASKFTHGVSRPARYDRAASVSGLSKKVLADLCSTT